MLAKQNAVVQLLRISPVADELAACSPRRVTSLYLVGGTCAGRAARPAGTDLDFTTDARPEQVLRLVPGWADAIWDTGIAFGTVGADQGRRAAGDHHVPGGHATTGSRRNPEVALRRLLEDDLLRRDFTVNAMAVELPRPSSSSTRTTGWPRCRPGAGHPGDAGGVVRRRPAADAAGRAVRLASSASPRRRGWSTAMTEMAEQIAPDHPRAGPGRAVQAALRRAPAAGLELLVRHRAGRPRAARGAGACGWRSTSTTSTRTSTSTRWPCWTRRSTLEEDGAEPDLVLRLAALLHDIGKPATRRHEPGGGVSFHHHEVVGAKMVRKRLRALRYPQGDHRGRRPAGVPAPAVPRLRQGRVDRLGGAPVRHRRRARCCRGCTSWCARTARRATGAGPPRCSAPTTTWRTRIARIASRGGPGQGAARTWTATRS